MAKPERGGHRDACPTPLMLPRHLRDPDDHEAWREFAERYMPMIRRWGGSFGLEEEDARDMAQEVAARVSEAIRRFHYDPDKGRFRGWLKTITRNACNDFHRRNQAAPPPRQFHGQAADGEYLEPVFEEIAARELHQAVLETLRLRVSARDYEVFVARVFEQQDAARVAKRAGVGVGQMHRIVRAVKDEYARILRELGEEDGLAGAGA